ncbi:hypothetical protein FHS74_005492 [Nitrospirillum iridis]|uniref:Uncharacterized protein n=1 Tax=Nitrospirillum iridis TaxID=765888 RepID=A0A7X0B370_9PROT|nr:hypothetical protein [Nitrospirillum iridis]
MPLQDATASAGASTGGRSEEAKATDVAARRLRGI